MKILVLACGALCAAHAQALVLGVTEGVTYRATDNQIEAKFAPVAEQLSKALKQPVTIKVIATYDELRETLKQQQVDLAYVHPAHVALEAIKANQYQAIAWTTGFTEYKVSLLCRTGTPASDWKAVAGKKLVTPDPDSITAVMTRAMLREHQAAVGQTLNTRFQDAVPFYVENRFADYGATAAKAVVKTWKDGGGAVCAESRAVPIKQWLASSKLDAASTAAARETLLALAQNDAGKKALTTLGYAGMVPTAAPQEQALIAWLGIGAAAAKP